MKIALETLLTLVDLFKFVPSTVPYRYEVIFEYAKAILETNKSDVSCKFVVLELDVKEEEKHEKFVLYITC